MRKVILIASLLIVMGIQSISFADAAGGFQPYPDKAYLEKLSEKYMIIGKYIVYMPQLTQELYDAAYLTIEDYRRLYYRSEFADGAWFKLENLAELGELYLKGSGDQVTVSEFESIKYLMQVEPDGNKILFGEGADALGLDEFIDDLKEEIALVNAGIAKTVEEQKKSNDDLDDDKKKTDEELNTLIEEMTEAMTEELDDLNTKIDVMETSLLNVEEVEEKQKAATIADLNEMIEVAEAMGDQKLVAELKKELAAEDNTLVSEGDLQALIDNAVDDVAEVQDLVKEAEKNGFDNIKELAEDEVAAKVLETEELVKQLVDKLVDQLNNDEITEQELMDKLLEPVVEEEPDAGTGEDDGKEDPDAGTGEDDGKEDTGDGTGEDDGKEDTGDGTGEDDGKEDTGDGTGEDDGKEDTGDGTGEDDGKEDTGDGTGEDDGKEDTGDGTGEDDGKEDTGDGTGEEDGKDDAGEDADKDDATDAAAIAAAKEKAEKEQKIKELLDKASAKVNPITKDALVVGLTELSAPMEAVKAVVSDETKPEEASPVDSIKEVLELIETKDVDNAELVEQQVKYNMNQAEEKVEEARDNISELEDENAVLAEEKIDTLAEAAAALNVLDKYGDVLDIDVAAVLEAQVDKLEEVSKKELENEAEMKKVPEELDQVIAEIEAKEDEALKDVLKSVRRMRARVKYSSEDEILDNLKSRYFLLRDFKSNKEREVLYSLTKLDEKIRELDIAINMLLEKPQIDRKLLFLKLDLWRFNIEKNRSSYEKTKKAIDSYESSINETELMFNNKIKKSLSGIKSSSDTETILNSKLLERINTVINYE